MKKIIIFLLLFLNIMPQSALAQVQKVIYVGAPNISIPVIVAVEKGYFKEQGLDVEYQPITTGKLAMEAILSGRADFGSLVITNVSYAGFQTGALRVVASNGTSFDDGIVFPANSAIKSVADLKGKKIGLAFSTSSQDFLRRILAQNGLAWADIQPVNLQPPAFTAALKGGQVDAVVTWQPWRAAVRKAFDGNVREIINNKNIYPRHSFIATSEKYLNANPNVPEKFLRAVIKAEEFINKNNAETAAILAKIVKQDVEIVKTFYMVMNVNMDADLESLVQSYAAWVIQNQDDFKGKSMPNFKQNFAPQYLNSIAPERVEKK